MEHHNSWVDFVNEKDRDFWQEYVWNGSLVTLVWSNCSEAKRKALLWRNISSRAFSLPRSKTQWRSQFTQLDNCHFSRQQMVLYFSHEQYCEWCSRARKPVKIAPGEECCTIQYLSHISDPSHQLPTAAEKNLGLRVFWYFYILIRSYTHSNVNLLFLHLFLCVHIWSQVMMLGSDELKLLLLFVQ